MEKMEINSLEELFLCVQKILSLLKNKRVENQASVLALQGNLGAGKTAFVKMLAHELGVEEEVTSPTFVVMKRYQTTRSELFSELVHIDAYRIEDIDEMRVLRFGEVLEEKDTIICIEWAERIEALLPKHTLVMNIEIKSDTQRTVTLQ